MVRVAGLWLVLGILGAAPCLAGGPDGSPTVSKAEELRKEGSAGLQTALAKYDEAAEELAKVERNMLVSCGGPASMESSHEKAKKALESARSLVDEVAGQRGAEISRLYWYTDLADAKAAAAESGKPILSLRMLGKLTDEYSCANSRFFRTALYSNEEVSGYLRDHFVLHWQSVRPVPRVMIDFGDGRKLQRTITGNSAHYVLDAQGRVLDALPGLYGPQAFAEWIKRTNDFSQRMHDTADAQRVDWVASYHAERLEAVNEAIRSDLATVAPAMQAKGLEDVEQVSLVNSSVPPTAAQASFRAEGKFQQERPLVAALVPSDAALMSQPEDFWRRIALMHIDQAKLDPVSIELMQRENPTDPHLAQIRTASKALIEDPILRVVRNFEEAMAVDTVKNEYTLHRKIHQWFVDGGGTGDVDALNERVYAELFLTPSSDPWLGLAPADAYSGLTCGGLTADAKPQAAKY